MVWVRRALFIACFGPLVWLAWAWWVGALGVNPIEANTRFLGTWAATFLLASLSISPLRRRGVRGVMLLRRTYGLAAFWYAALHLLSYVGLDHFFAWDILADDLARRRYIMAGMAAFVLLAVLAATSPRRVFQAMGETLWLRVHKLVFPAAILVVLHHFWMTRLDMTRPTLHAVVLAILLGERLFSAWQNRRGA